MIEFLTPGQRIKKLRKMLNLKQHELQGKKVKRNFISMIENDKRGLSSDTAKHLSQKFIKRANELGINLYIDEAYLLMSQEEEARQYCLNELSKNLNLDALDYINDISIRFNLKDVEMYALIKKGDYYFEAKEYSKALTNYVKALNNIMTNRQYEAYLFNRLGLCKMNELHYTEALEFFSVAYLLAGDNNDLITRKNSIYNISLCHRKIFDFEISIKYINEFLTLCNRDEELISYVYANVIKANSYRDLKEFDSALEIYEHLRQSIDINSPIAAYVYDNLGLLYSEFSEYEKALECLDISQKIRTDADIENLAKSLIDKASILVKQSRNYEALILINLGIDVAKKYKDFEYEFKGYHLLTDIYKELGDTKKLEEIYLKLFAIAKEKEDYMEMFSVSNKLCFIYLEDNNVEKIRNLLESHSVDIK